jgi:hypothetical protein
VGFGLLYQASCVIELCDHKNAQLAAFSLKVPSRRLEKGKLQVALANDEYNPEKHKNDLLDAEQLIYLFDATLCFLTCDKGVSNFVKKSSQASRVITVSPNDLNNAASAEKVLRGIVRSNPSKGVASNGSGPER